MYKTNDSTHFVFSCFIFFSQSLGLDVIKLIARIAWIEMQFCPKITQRGIEILSGLDFRDALTYGLWRWAELSEPLEDPDLVHITRSTTHHLKLI